MSRERAGNLRSPSPPAQSLRPAGASSDRPFLRRAIPALALVGWLLSAGTLGAWGPHPTITQAALDVLGTNHPLYRCLGDHARRLTNHCWMADFKRLPFRDVDQDFYADDYLIFPGMPRHLDHICPEVRQTYAPYFRRALQALRTESPANAARWIGSLLHFTEDSGSPPHAAEIRGPTHIKMENWVDASRIRLDGYRPRQLGTNEADALAGYLRRMEELIAYSKPRGQKLSTSVLIGLRSVVEPVALECALETSRVAADLLHTLGALAEAGAHASDRRGPDRASDGDDDGRWFGQIRSVDAPMFERVPARVRLRGTPFATLADPSGAVSFRGLPLGRYDAIVARPGSESATVPIVVSGGAEGPTTVPQLIALGSGSLVRNSDFRLRWVRPEAPDQWTETPQGWEGEVIALAVGRRYALKVRFRPDARGEVLLRWSRQVEYDLPQNVRVPAIETRPLRPGNADFAFTASESMALLQLTVRGERPEEVCASIELRLEEAAGEP